MLRVPVRAAAAPAPPARRLPGGGLRGLVGLAVTACVAWGAGCAAGFNNTGSSSGNEFDGGGADAAGDTGGAFDSTAFDSGAPDTSAGQDGPSGGDGGNPDAGLATIVFLHASPSLPSLRLCWAGIGPGQAAKVVPFPSDNEMPASNYPGIPVGGAAWLTDAANLGKWQLTGRLYAVRAKVIAGKTTPCDMLLCTGSSTCLTPSFDYWPVGTLPSPTPGVTTLVAIAGCLGAVDPLASVGRCGSTWDPVKGNLHLDVAQVATFSNGSPDAGSLLVQAAQLSPALQSLQGDAGAATVSFGPENDAQSLVAQLPQEGDLLPLVPMPIALPAALPSFGDMGFAVDVTGADASSAAHLWMSLAQAQELVSPTQNPVGYYGAGGTYVIAVLGDPNAPHAFAPQTDGGYDGTGLHVLLLPAAASP
jgi:hypothetical protein